MSGSDKPEEARVLNDRPDPWTAYAPGWWRVGRENLLGCTQCPIEVNPFPVGVLVFLDEKPGVVLCGMHKRAEELVASVDKVPLSTEERAVAALELCAKSFARIASVMEIQWKYEKARQ